MEGSITRPASFTSLETASLVGARSPTLAFSLVAHAILAAALLIVPLFVTVKFNLR
jgi:hypothetical protein